MQEKKLWLFIHQNLQQGLTVALILVVERIGSSPGRQGHKMAVSEDGELCGTIGGGAMEYKQVEACKKLLKRKEKQIIKQQLVHSRLDKEKWSGLSCSGEQTILTYILGENDLLLLENILASFDKEEAYRLIFLEDYSIKLEVASVSDLPQISYHYRNEEEWFFQFLVGIQEKVYIIGAGHVGLALCRQLSLLDFQVILIDNRPGLPTEEYDQFISKKIITKYKKVATFVPSTVHDYIVLMTFSSALDALVLSQLIENPCRYIGLMASKTKAERIGKTMLEKGFTEEQYERVHTPIGLSITCNTPAEIAVSVAAQIIEIRNNPHPNDNR
jgi:xanthine dehydrogenase accessory factor